MKQPSHPCRRSVARYTTAVLAGSIVLFAGNAVGAKPPKAPPAVELTLLGTYASGIYNAGGSEIAAHDPLTQRLYVVNAQNASVNVLNISNPAAPTLITNLSMLPFGGVANSVSAHEGLVAVAIEATPNRTDPGKVVFFDSSFTVLSVVSVGAVPDMLTFTHKGRYVLVANEGEPNSYNETNSVDPEGSVSIIDLRDGPATLTQANVHTAGFTAFNGTEVALRAAGIRIFGTNATVAQDLEPEYLTVSPDDTTAWVTLQENNAMATIDIASAAVTSMVSLGLKDHSLLGNGLDPNNNGVINIGTWPVKGLYQPDGIAAYPIGTELFLFMANEGDVRTDWPGLNEETTVGAATYILDPTVFPNASTLKNNSNLGRLRVSKFSGDLDGDGDYDEIHPHGGRSFSIRKTDGSLVFDSGDDFEQVTAGLHTAGLVIFNASNDNNTFDNRSRAKGPEPEGIAVGRAFQRTWAFTGLERIGGVMVYDVTDPSNARFATYANNRNFVLNQAITPANFYTFGDLGPEGILFIDEGDSPTGEPLVVTANEVSGTTTIFQLNKVGP